MAESLVYRLVKDVELNRRALIVNAQSKGKIISDGASLSEAVQVNNSINPSDPATPIEVRFFDADGTLLQQSFIDYGGSVTPPENPNYDPQRLTFKRWASAIGERFDNITHDVDYGALYTINDGAYHLFCTFNDTTGYTVTLSPYQNKANTITIDWGDGTPNDTKTNTGSTRISHTYAQAGDYEIIVSSDTPIDYPTYYYHLYNYILSTSGSESVIDALINAYMPIVYSNNIQSTEGLQTLVMNNFYISGNNYFSRIKNVVVNNSLFSQTSTNYVSCYLSNTGMFIIDNNVNMRMSFDGMFNKLDKLIIPETVSWISTTNFCYTLDKLIILSSSVPVSISANSIRSIQLLNNNVGSLPSLTNCYTLEEYIYNNKNIVKTGQFFAPYSKLNSVILPNCEITNSILQNMYYLQSVILPQNFNQSLTISSYQITIPSIIDMLNKVQDNTGGTAQTLTFTQDNIQIQLLNTFVVLDNGIWVQATRTTPNAMTLIEAFNSKNWTIA